MNKADAQKIANRLNGSKSSTFGIWVPDWCPFRRDWNVITNDHFYFWMDGGIYSNGEF